MEAPPGLSLRNLAVLSLIGGALGAALLLVTDDRTFSKVVPWLLLVATLLFTIGPTLLRKVNNRQAGHASAGKSAAGILAVSIYAWGGVVAWSQALVMMIAATAGGYFGARIARRISASVIRTGIVATGLIMTTLFFLCS